MSETARKSAERRLPGEIDAGPVGVEPGSQLDGESQGRQVAAVHLVGHHAEPLGDDPSLEVGGEAVIAASSSQVS